MRNEETTEKNYKRKEFNKCSIHAQSKKRGVEDLCDELNIEKKNIFFIAISGPRL